MTGKGHPLTQVEKERAAAMLDDGASFREVARTLGRSDMTIGNHFRGRSQWNKYRGMEYQRMRKALDAIPVHV